MVMFNCVQLPQHPPMEHNFLALREIRPVFSKSFCMDKRALGARNLD